MDHHPSAHPTPETLEAYGLGRLEEALAEAVVGHLEDCPECRQRVAEAAPDTFLDQLRDAQARSEVPPPGESEPTFDSAATGGSPMVSDDIQTADGDGPDGVGLQPGTRIGYFGDYELQRVLGEGGMGIVYEAQQLTLNRPVALKMIRAARFPSADEVRRFHNEAEAVARLDHPNIVPIFEVGRYDDQHYFSMKLIGGESLDKRLKDYVADARRAARLVAATADAIHHAHQRGILHRDLKPANILIDSDGQPHVTDFGLAKRVDGDSEQTRSGAIVGTPAYMAPEQASGKRGAVTTSTDVYGLGAVLYALSTGRAPFAGTTVMDTLEQVRERPPELPRKLNPGVPRDLEVVCLKCLEKDPRRRYASAAALGDDLRHWLAGEPIAARPVAKAARLWMWSRRNPTLAAALSAAALLLITLTVGSLWAAYHFQRIAGAEQSARQQSDRRLAVVSLERGQAACEKGDIAAGLLWFVQGWRMAEAASDPRWQRLARRNIAAWQRYLPRLKVVVPSWIMRVTFSPDGKRILVLSDPSPGAFISGNAPSAGTAQLWDVATATPCGQAMQLGGEAVSGIFSPDGRAVLTTSSGNGRLTTGGTNDKYIVRLWDAATGSPLREPLELQGTVRGAAFSANGEKALVIESLTPSIVRAWDAFTATAVGSPFVCPEGDRVLAISPDCKAVLTGSDENTLRLWELGSGRLIGPPIEHRQEIGFVEFCRNGKAVLIRSGREARLWDVGNGREIGQLRQLGAGFQLENLSPDGDTVVGWRSGGNLQLWDVDTGRPIGQRLPFRAWYGLYDHVPFSPDGRMALVGGPNETPWLLDAATGLLAGQPVRDPATYAPLPAAQFSPDAKSVAIPDPGGTRVWDVTPSQPVGRPFPRRSFIQSVVFSVEGRMVLIADREPAGRPRAQLWDTSTGRPIGQPLEPFSDFENALPTLMVASPDTRTVLVLTLDGTARIWDITSGQRIGSPLSHRMPIDAAAFSPDGRSILTGSTDRTAQLWDAASARPIGAPLVHGAAVLSVAFSPGGRIVLTGGRDSMARRWDATTGQPIGPPLPCSDPVDHVAFDTDGRSIITQSKDGTTRAWDAATGQPIGTPRRSHRARVDGDASESARVDVGERSPQRPAGAAEVLVFERGRGQFISPCDQVVVAGDEDRRVRILDAETGYPIGPPLAGPRSKSSPFSDGLSAHFSPDGRSVLINDVIDGFAPGEDAQDARVWRLWRIADLPDDFPRIAAWVAVLTGLELDALGDCRRIDHEAWQRLRDELQALGGPPAVEQSPSLDPLIFGRDPLARARAWIDRKRWVEAESAFRDVLAAWPGFGLFWVEHGRFLIARSRRQEAAASFARAFALGVRDPKFVAEVVGDDALFERVLALSPADGAILRLLRAEFLAEIGRQDEARETLARMGDLPLEKDESPTLRLRRAHLLIRLGRSSQVDAELSRALQLAPEDLAIAHDLAIARLLAGDLMGSRSVCAAILPRVASQAMLRRINPATDRPLSDAVVRRVADIAYWSPDAVTELGALNRAADSYRPGFQERNRLAATILYRAGRYQEALKRLQTVSYEYSARDSVLMAMIHSRLGNARQARRMLAIADQWISKADRSHPSSEGRNERPHWHSLIQQHTTRLLRSEAEALIVYDPLFPADPFAH
jgi:WD40 repeat protein/tetratricopeptide (TPR) repeat protein